MKSPAKPRILAFIDWYLPGYKAGGPVTSLATMIDRLKEDFDFYVITRNHDYMETEAYPEIEANTWIERDKHLHVYYFSPEKLNTQNLKKIALSSEAETWYITGIYSRYFSIIPLRLSRKVKIQRCVLAPRGMLSEHALGLKTVKKRIFLFFARMLQLYSRVVFQSTSEQETIDIKGIVPDASVVFAPNLPRLAGKEWKKSLAKKKASLELIFLGRIAPEKNTVEAIEMLKDWSESTHYKSSADISLDIYGQVYNEAYWQRCQDLIRQLPSNISVRKKETVSPEVLPELLRKYHVLFLPSKGENFGHAIIESMAAGLPVIISDQTPWKGLEKKGCGWDLSLSDREKFIDAIQSCIDLEDEAYTKMSQSAFDYAKKVAEDDTALQAHKYIFTQ